MTIGEFSRAVAQDENSVVADRRRLFENGVETRRGRSYVLDRPDICRAVDAAIALGRPLLVAGEPGCGKTELGHAIARHLDIRRLHFYSVKSTSDANEVLYVYDAIKRFGESRNNTDVEVGNYIEFQALGRAILDAHQRSAIAHLLRGRHSDYRTQQTDFEPARSVVVIDEIDKASADFANDLLHEIEGLRFRVKGVIVESSIKRTLSDFEEFGAWIS